jgi:hypothetical protein
MIQSIDKPVLTEHRQFQIDLLMNNSSAKLSPILRFVAAGTFAAWLMTVGFCFAK